VPDVTVLDSTMYYEDLGEELILDRNLFVEQVLPNAMLGTLSSEEFDAYRAPFTERAYRLPTLAWPREIPVDGEPADLPGHHYQPRARFLRFR
jgi:haloalkane dehalogenase